MNYFIYVIVILSLINLFRVAAFLIGADIYDLRFKWNSRKGKKPPTTSRPYRPVISIIIPAYNEEIGIIRTVKSVLANDYFYKQIIVIDDGSTDKTYNKLRYFKRKFRVRSLKIVHQRNQGKATAINNAVKNHARGSLVMVLDADSILHKHALTRMVAHFHDKEVVAAACNVKIIEDHRLLTAAQRLEYIIGHRMKRALTTLNIEYIIGGIGSTFRKSVVKACEYFDTDTMTEDIDFTMKIIARKGNRKVRVIFAADAVTYTEAAVGFKGLLHQRFRWKYGRMQTFNKNRPLFFSRSHLHNKQLSWVYLPFTVFSDIMLLFDPLLTGAVIYSIWRFGGAEGFVSLYLFFMIYGLFSVLGEQTESRRQKLKLMLLVPIAHALLMIISMVDFIVLVQSVVRFPAILKGTSKGQSWQHVERSGAAVSLSL